VSFSLSSRSSNLIAIALILAIGLGVAAIFKLSTLETQISGPRSITSDNHGGFYLVAGGTLYHLDQTGKILAHDNLQTLGISGTVGDVQAFRDGVLLVDGEAGLIYDCENGRCQHFATLPEPATVMPQVVHLALATDGKTVYAVTGFSNRIDAFDSSGKYLREVSADIRLSTPNELSVWQDGTLNVADTDHSRIVTMQEEGSKTRVVRKFSTLSKVSPLKFFPLSLLRDAEGRFWIIVSDMSYRHGDLLLFSAEGKPLKKIPLASNADPMAVALTGTGVIVADYSRFTLSAVSLDGDKVSSFGSEVFKQEMRQLKEEKLHWRWMRYGIMGLLVMFLLIALVVARQDEKRRRREMKQEQKDGFEGNWFKVARQYAELDYINGILWMRPQQKLSRKLKRARFVVLALLPLGLSLFVVFAGHIDIATFTVVVFPLAFAALMLYMTKDMLQMRIGTDGKLLYLDNGRGRRTYAAGESVFLGKKHAVIGQQVVMLINGYNQTVFPTKPYEHYFKPLLEKGIHINGWDMFKRLLQLKDAPTIGTIILLMISGVIFSLKYSGLMDIPRPVEVSAQHSHVSSR